MKLMLVAFSLYNYVTLADAYGIIALSELRKRVSSKPQIPLPSGHSDG